MNGTTDTAGSDVPGKACDLLLPVDALDTGVGCHRFLFGERA